MALMAIFSLSIFLSFSMRAESIPATKPCKADSLMAVRLMQASFEAGRDVTVGQRVAAAALSLVGSVCDTDTCDGAMFLNFSRSMTFPNLCLAAAKTSALNFRRVSDFFEAFTGVDCRKGEYDGFTSRFHYGSDWIMDNIYRGNFKELTETYSGGATFRTKSLDYVTRNRGLYPELADSVTFERMRMIEMGYRTHKIPHLKKETVNRKWLAEDIRQGDILVLLSGRQDYDVYDIGVVVIHEDGPHLLHLDPVTRTVVVEPDPLNRYFKRNGQQFYGYRWLRPQ